MSTSVCHEIPPIWVIVNLSTKVENPQSSCPDFYPGYSIPGVQGGWDRQQPSAAQHDTGPEDGL